MVHLVEVNRIDNSKIALNDLDAKFDIFYEVLMPFLLSNEVGITKK